MNPSPLFSDRVASDGISILNIRVSFVWDNPSTSFSFCRYHSHWLIIIRLLVFPSDHPLCSAELLQVRWLAQWNAVHPLVHSMWQPHPAAGFCFTDTHNYPLMLLFGKHNYYYFHSERSHRVRPGAKIQVVVLITDTEQQPTLTKVHRQRKPDVLRSGLVCLCQRKHRRVVDSHWITGD